MTVYYKQHDYIIKYIGLTRLEICTKTKFQAYPFYMYMLNFEAAKVNEVS